MRHVLITGAGSYIGTSVELWLQQFPDKYKVHTLDMRGDTWKQHDFSQYQVVFHVAAIVHLNSGRDSASIRNQYYEVNTELACETAEKAKISGVEQFVFMSSMSVYGETEHITQVLHRRVFMEIPNGRQSRGYRNFQIRILEWQF